MPKWYSVVYNQEFCSVERKSETTGRYQKTFDVLGNIEGEKARPRAEYIVEAANTFIPDWKRKIPRQQANVMHGPIPWVIIEGKGDKTFKVYGDDPDPENRIELVTTSQKKMAEEIKDYCNQFEDRQQEELDRLILTKSAATGEGIKKSLSDGCLIHGFRSGGGLRVIVISKNDKTKGYGESPDVLEALKHADEDYLAGHRPYNKVYGKIYPHYMTGSSEKSCPLDEMLLRGYSFDCTQKNKTVKFVLKAYVTIDFPKEVMDLAKSTGKTQYWKTDRGFYYTMNYNRSMTANGQEGWSSGPIFAPEGERGHHGTLYQAEFIGTGKDLMSAFDAAHEKYKAPHKTELVTEEQLKKLGIDPNTHSDEKLRQKGIDPFTMKPIKK